MKIVSYLAAAGPRAGLLLNDQILDTGTAGLPEGVVGLIQLGDDGLQRLRELERAAGSSTVQSTPLAGTRLLAPIPRPTKNVYCLGLNYQAHIAEGAALRGAGMPGSEGAPTRPQWPTYFTKAPAAVIGPEMPIPLHPHVTSQMDWEVELALVIGRGGVDIPAERAHDHIFGYTVANDVSAREVQRRHGQQWFKGKSLDGACPLGPWIVTRDELGEANNLRIECRVNGATKQSSTTSLLIFTIPEIIAGLSAGMTLDPGDVILTGTPDGVGFARNPPEFLKSGDIVECEIEGIGVLRNPVA